MTGLESFFLSLLLNILILELSPKPDLPQAKKYGLNDFSVPTATEDRSQTVGWGTFKVAGNVIWYGDYQAKPVTERIKVSLFQSKTLTKGHLYQMGLWMTLCGVTCDEVQEVRLGDYVVWSGNQPLSKTEPTVIDVDKRWTNAEGQEIADGMVGRLVFFNHRVREGRPYSPLPNPYMESILGEGNVPAYPNSLHVLWLGPSSLGQLYEQAQEEEFANWLNLQLGGLAPSSGLRGFVSTGPSVSPISFVLKRKPDITDALSQVIYKPSNDMADADYLAYLENFYEGYAEVNGDANPALVQLEALTSRVPGMGPRLSALTVGLDSFLSSAQTCKADGYGVSFSWEVSRPTTGLVGDISQLINSVVEVDERTGQLCSKLIRQSDEPVHIFDDSNLIAIESFTRTAVEQAPNRIEVPFVDRANNWVERVSFAKNLAAIKQAGTVIEQRAEFLGVSRETLAQLLATREMAKVSAPLAKASFSGWLPVGLVLQPGDLIAFTHPTLGQTLRMRVVTSRFGGYDRMLRVDIEAVEDVFQAGYNFDTGTTPLPTPQPPAEPVALTQPALMLAPYALTGDNADHALYVGNDPGTGVNTYRLGVQTAAAWDAEAETLIEDSEQEPAITGMLDYAISSTEASPVLTLTLSNEAVAQWNRNRRGSVFVIVGNEWLQASGWTLAGNTLTAATVERAIFDTVPARHEVGSTARLLLGFFVTTERLRTQGAVGLAPTDGAAVMTARAESRGGSGVLSMDAAAGSEATLAAQVGVVRALAPLLPGLVKLSDVQGSLEAGDGVPTVSASTSMTLTWNNRNRLQRLTAPWYFSGNNAEPGTFLRVKFEHENEAGNWQDAGTLNASPGASTLTLNTTAVAAGKAIRLTLWACASYGPGSDYEVCSQPLTMGWTVA